MFTAAVLKLDSGLDDVVTSLVVMGVVVLRVEFPTVLVVVDGV